MGLGRVCDRLSNCQGCSECYGRGPRIPWADANDTTAEWICPTLDQFKVLSHTARGKQFLAMEVAQGDLPVTDDLIQIFYSDPGCGLCTSICPQLSLDFLKAMREEIAERGLLPEPNRKLDLNIRERHNIFGSPPERRANWARGLKLSKKGETLYFAGCYASYRQPSSAQAAVKILRACGVETAYLAEDEWCCGLHPAWSSQRNIEVEMAYHNLEKILESGAQRVVFSCAGCYSSFKTRYREIAKLDFEIMHMAELLVELLHNGRLQMPHGHKKKVTYHDPCHLGRGHLGKNSEVYMVPRELLKSMDSVELIEMAFNSRWSYCCGGGAGVVSAAYPNVTKSMSRKRLKEAKEAASILLTTCPRCIENLTDTAKEQHLNISVKDLTSFLAEEMGI